MDSSHINVNRSTPLLDSLITQEVLAERLDHRDRSGKVSTRTLEEWRYKGIGPEYIRPAGTRKPYYTPAAVEAWLSDGRYTCNRDEVAA